MPALSGGPRRDFIVRVRSPLRRPRRAGAVRDDAIRSYLDTGARVFGATPPAEPVAHGADAETCELCQQVPISPEPAPRHVVRFDDDDCGPVCDECWASIQPTSAPAEPVAEEAFAWPISAQTDHCSKCQWYGDLVEEDKCPQCGATYCMIRAVGFRPGEGWPSRASINLLEMDPWQVADEIQRLRDIEEDVTPAPDARQEALIEAAEAFLRAADRDTVLANNLRAAIAAAKEGM